MRIAELARLARVKVSTIRYYERSGALPEPERSSAGYRQYDDEALRYVRFLRRGQELGFTLSELRSVVEYSAIARDGAVPQPAIQAAAMDKISDLDRKIIDLTRTRDALAALAATPCVVPEATCPIVEALGGDASRQGSGGDDGNRTRAISLGS